MSKDGASRVLGISKATDSSPVFASEVSGKRERHLVESFLGMVVVLDLDAVICVNARAAKFAVARAESVFAHAVVIEDQRNPRCRAIQNLSAQARPAADSAVGLPSIDDPG